MERGGNDTWSLEDQHLVDKKETNLEQDMGRKENGVELLTKKRKRGKRHEGVEMMSNGGMGLTNNEAKKKLAADAHHDSSDREEEITAKVAMRKMGPSSSNHAEEYYYEDEDTNRKEMEESSIFGQTLGSNNATWVECDKCGKVLLCARIAQCCHFICCL